MDWDRYSRTVLEALARQGLLREPRVVEGQHGPEPLLGGRRVLGLCSNNYLGMAGDERILDAALSAATRTGSGTGASRHISGTNAEHRLLEQKMAAFVALPHALVFSTGYAANLGALQALASREDVLFSDELNHASLIDGCRLSRAQTFVYRHRDLLHLERLLRDHRASGRQALIVTESLFSMDGDLASLRELRRLADRYDCGLFVDEAHALGVFGERGRGLCAHAGVIPDVLVGTLGKAFGCSGAFVAGAQAVVALIENRARSYIFSTATPAYQAAAARAAADLVASADDRRDRLFDHARTLRTRLQALGYPVLQGNTQIIPVLIGSSQATMAISHALFEYGVFVHGIRPPTVAPGTARLRITPMATHSEEQIERALAAFSACRTLL